MNDNEIFVKINCPCFNEEKTVNLNYYSGKALIKCPKCKKYQHKICLEKLTNMNPYYICPDCQLENLDLFIEQKKKIARILFHGKDLPNVRIIKCCFEIAKIIPLKDNNIKGDEYILFRCLKIDDEGFNTLWPGFFDMYINKLMQSNPLNEEKELTREIAFRVSEKIKKKTYLKVSSDLKNFKKTGKNELLLNFNGKNNKKDDFILSIDYVREKKIEEVIESIPSKNKEKEKNENLKYNELISLLDIYTDSDFINIPAKGWKCSHLGCFNLKTFLGYMEHTRSYKCPFCSQKVGLIYKCNEMKNIIKKYYLKGKNEVLVDSNYNVIEENEKNDGLDFLKLKNTINENINVRNINEIIEDNNISQLDNIEKLDYIIDEFFIKNFKNKKDKRFEISIKTDWDKFFSCKCLLTKNLLINK